MKRFANPIALLASILMLGATFGGNLLGQANQLIALKAARLYDGTGAPPIQNAVVLVRGNTIQAVGTDSQVTIPAGAQILDLGNDTLMPGLFDTHGHLRYRYAGGGAVGRAEQSFGKEGPIAMRFVKNARTQLLTGITTMRMTGEVAWLDFDVKEAIDSGMVPGPRIIPSGLLITATAGHGGGPDNQIDGPLEAARMVRENYIREARLIKLAMTDLSPSAAQMTLEEVKGAVDMAHASGLPVTVHCTGNWGSAIRTAVLGGADTIEHARPLSDEIIQLLKEHGTSVSLTPLVYIGFRPSPAWWDFLDHKVEKPEDWINFMRDEMLEWRRRHPQWESEDRPYADNESNRALRDYFPAVKKRQAEILKAYQAGIPISLGLDTIYGGITLSMEYMVEAGIPLPAVIHMATGSAARISRVDDRLGTLKPGLWADIISVQGDPATDIRNLHKIHLVMKDGRRYDTLTWN